MFSFLNKKKNRIKHCFHIKKKQNHKLKRTKKKCKESDHHKEGKL